MCPSSAQIDLPALARPLKRRIENGSEVLFEMEQRGETGGDYERWVAAYIRLVEDYTVLTECMILRGKTSIDAVEPPLPTPVPDPEQTSLLLGESSLTSDHLAGLKDRIA